MALTVKPLETRPKGARGCGGYDIAARRQVLLELTGLACESLEDGGGWAQLDGWQDYWLDAREARRAMAYVLRDLRGAEVTRVGDTLYLHVVPPKPWAVANAGDGED
jgi:hypothetical protein